ncbi:hypothetical protein J6590_100189 [Homalodisca vitripennis]|nr:hypothetical protein J6590_100189 [Homalodisca vitripennis]
MSHLVWCQQLLHSERWLEEELRFSTGPCRRGFKTRTDQRAGRNASPDTSLTDQLIAGPTEQTKSPHRV